MGLGIASSELGDEPSRAYVFPPMEWDWNSKISYVGQILWTKLAGITWNGRTCGHIRATGVTRTGFTCYALKDHPDAGGTVHFNFYKSGCVLHHVRAWFPQATSALGGPGYDIFSYLVWFAFAASVDAEFVY